jgi:hypothetical protein
MGRHSQAGRALVIVRRMEISGEIPAGDFNGASIRPAE